MKFAGGRAVAYGRRDLGVSVAALAAFVLFLTVLMASPAWAQAELTVEKTDNPDPVRRGDELTYTIVVENPGDETAENVVLDDILPASTFVSISTTAGSCPTKPDQGDPSTPVSCNLGDIEDGDSVTVTIRVRPTAAGTITNQATARADGISPVVDTATTTVLPNLEIDKQDDPDPVSDPEDLLLYTLRVENRESTSQPVVVRDDLPLDKVDFVSASGNGFVCEEDGGIVRCEGNVPGNRTATVRIVVEPEVAGTIRNTGEVRFVASGQERRVDEDTEETVVEERAVSDDDNDNDGGNNDDGNNDDDNDTSDTGTNDTGGNATAETTGTADAADDATAEVTTADANGDTAEEICSSSERVSLQRVLVDDNSVNRQYGEDDDDDSVNRQYGGGSQYLEEDFESQFIIDCVGREGSGVLDTVAVDNLPETGGGLPILPLAGFVLVGIGVIVVRGLRDRP